MTHLIDKQKGYRQAVTIVEIDLNINDPLIDYSGDISSYNTPKTTAAGSTYTGSTQTYVFSDQQLGFTTPHFVCLMSVTSSPAILKAGDDVAASASAKVVLSDFISNDVFELPVPYQANRISGSFFGKLLERNYLQNRNIRIKRGYDATSTLGADFQTEHYVIKSHSGLDANGSISLSLIDRLFFASETKAKAPQTSNVTLNGPITNSSTSFNFIGTNFGDKSKDYTIQVADVGVIVIDNELMTYTVATYSAGTGSLTVVRGFSNTIAVTHESRAAIQGCFITESAVDTFGAQNITDINRRLINDFTNLGAGFINDTSWDAEKAGNLSKFNFTNIITEPTEVKKLLKETIQSSGSWMYFDTVLNELIIGASARFDLPVATLTDNTNILQDSMRVSPQDSLQVTRSTIRYNKLDYTQGDDNRYYGNAFQKIDGLVESDAQTGQQNEAKEIKSNWLTGSTTDAPVANSVPQLRVERFNNPPLKYTFKLDSRDVGLLPNTETLWMGSVVEIETRTLINANGTIKTNAAQITSIKPSSLEDTWDIVALSYNANIPTNVDLYINTNAVDFLLTDLLTTTEAREYIVVISSGVRFTASSVSNYAFDTGVLFAGATLKLINQGFIVPSGGFGGFGGEKVGPDPAINGGNGFDGGDGLNIQVTTILDNLSGLIAGGGGGGQGGNPGTVGSTWGGGGGGGAGDTGGAGGLASGGTATDGEAGSFNFPGDGGLHDGTDAEDGFNGGDLGENGLGAGGGTAGIAITTNGNSLTILSGNNPSQIKGAVV